jgi:hypothetical protein
MLEVLLNLIIWKLVTEGTFEGPLLLKEAGYPQHFTSNSMWGILLTTCCTTCKAMRTLSPVKEYGVRSTRLLPDGS